PVAMLTVEDFRRQFETNVFGVLRTVYATLPDIRRRRGRIAIIGSVSGHIATPGAAPYAMSKFAVRALAEALGHELARSGASVTLVSPGYVASEIRRVDNEGVLRAETPDPVPRFLIMPTDRAARQIVRAIARRRREVVVTGHGKAVVFLHRHAPWLTTAVIRKFGVRSRGEPKRRPRGARPDKQPAPDAKGGAQRFRARAARRARAPNTKAAGRARHTRPMSPASARA